MANLSGQRIVTTWGAQMQLGQHIKSSSTNPKHAYYAVNLAPALGEGWQVYHKVQTSTKGIYDNIVYVYVDDKDQPTAYLQKYTLAGTYKETKPNFAV